MPTHLHYIVSLAKSDLYLSAFQRDFKKWIARELFRLLKDEAKAGPYPVEDVFLKAGIVRKESPDSLIDLLRKEGEKVGQGFKLWRVDENPEVLASRTFFYQKLKYIHNNPVKAGYVRRASDYPYSSARNYELDDQNLIKVDGEWLE